jgi:hypothetical protein
MYTNDLLEEKRKAQKRLAEKAARESKEYAQVVEEVRKLYRARGWRLVFSRRKGVWSRSQTSSVK